MKTCQLDAQRDYLANVNAFDIFFYYRYAHIVNIAL